MRPHVESVKSSIKGGVEVALGARTLLLGVNGVGKSAVVNSIELAGTGRASDVAGRSILAKDADLAMLAPALSPFAFAHAVLSHGLGLASWELSRGHRARRSGPEIAFPLRDVQDALLGSPETARKWILRHGGSFLWTEVLALVPGSLHKRLSTQNFSPEEAPSALTAALETAKGRARDLRATAKAARSLSPPSHPPPTDQEISALEAVISAWQSRPDPDENPVSELELLTEALEAAKIRISALEGKARDLETDLGSLPPSQTGIEVRRAAVLVVEALANARARNCPICGGQMNPEDLAGKAQHGQRVISESVRLEDRRVRLSHDHEAAINELSWSRRELERLMTEQARAKAKAAETSEAAPPPTITLADAQARLRELLQAKVAWDSARRSEERALEADREAGSWDELADALGKAMAVLVGKARENFVARVQRFLPRMDLFGVDLLDGEREVLRVGLLRLAGDQMVLHAGLSGAEWARVTAALALATAPPDGPCVVCPEERAFDPGTLSDVLAAFGSALDEQGDRAPQVIVTSPVAPREVPQGWTVVQLGEPLWRPPVATKPKPAFPPLPPGASIFD